MSGKRLWLVGLGAPARHALRAEIERAQRTGPLAPVTVVAPSAVAGLSLRRLLARDGGLVGVRFETLPRVVELLGGRRVGASGRCLLSAPAHAAAVRAALAADPGPLAAVQDHPATVHAVARALRELRAAPSGGREALQRDPRGRHLCRLELLVARRLAGSYDEHDLLLAAIEAVRDGDPLLADLGHVVLFLPERLNAPEQRLVAALAEREAVTVLLGRTGDAVADASTERLAAELAAILGPAASDDGARRPPVGTAVISAPDPDGEVRAAVQEIARRLHEDHLPLHRMAILHPTGDDAPPYTLIAHEQLTAAGLPSHGPPVGRLADTLAGRTLLALLALGDHELRRDDVAALLAGAPILEQPGGREAPAHRWDLLSRRAGVVGGAEQWRPRLRAERRRRASRLSDLQADEEATEAQRERLRRDLDHLTRLEAFIEELTGALDPGPEDGWALLASWAQGLLQRYLGPPRSGPQAERDAYDQVIIALRRLGALDETGLPAFRAGLAQELQAPARRIGTFGHGVFVGPIQQARGLSFDVVLVLGLAEGSAPSRGHQDALLPDRLRRLLGASVHAERPADQRRAYLAALAAAPERVLLHPRSDPRHGRERLPSRWLLETATALASEPVDSDTLAGQHGRAWYRRIASLADSLQAPPVSASLQERDVRDLLQWTASGRDVGTHPLVKADPGLRRGLALQRCRRGHQASRFDGLVGPAGAFDPTGDRPLSPTTLQQWATCPYQFFLANVLQVSETPRPEAVERIAPMDRGQLVHEVLERFLTEVPPRSAPGHPWSDDERALLHAIADEVCAGYERRGLTGQPLLWRCDRRELHRDLDTFLADDMRRRREAGVLTAPEDVEVAFGRDAGDPPVRVRLDQGRELAFGGRIDRIDHSPDGRRVIVADYKTGSGKPYRGLEDDPVDRGKRLQLLVYGLAARARYPGAEVEAGYWLVSRQEKRRWLGCELTESHFARFRAVIGTIVAGLDRGVYPARPGDEDRSGFENCKRCPYDAVCPADRDRLWERKRTAPEFVPYAMLAGEPEQP